MHRRLTSDSVLVRRKLNSSRARFERRLLTRLCAVFASRSAPPRRKLAPSGLFRPRRDLVVGDEDDVRIIVEGKPTPLVFPLDWNAGGAGGRELNAMSWIE